MTSGPAPLALDGLAIVVNRANNTESLSIAQLRAIFSGRHRDWQAFGAGTTEIVLLSHQTGSDVHLEFQRMVMGMNNITGNALLVPSF